MSRFLLSLLLVALVLTIGFVDFLRRVPPVAGAAPEMAEAVVVFTGGGGARISAGMAVFGDGFGERLLISGVHADTSRARLSQLWTADGDKFDCCVDLGRKAQTTEGNAAEARDWAVANGYDSIILVTSEYHMPRALVFSRKTMPSTRIIPHPVASGLVDGAGRPTSVAALRTLVGEYFKYVAANIKIRWPGADE